MRSEYIEEKKLVETVLNLSAFGDVIENPKKNYDPSKVQDMTFKSFKAALPAADKTIQTQANCVTSKALMHTAQIKLLHWQTKSYAEHKALNKLFGDFVELTDNLVESVMGKYGRPVLNSEESTFVVKNYNFDVADDLAQYMKVLYDCYANECKSLFNPQVDSEIVNILDEIIAVIDKTKYLLTLK